MTKSPEMAECDPASRRRLRQPEEPSTEDGARARAQLEAYGTAFRASCPNTAHARRGSPKTLEEAFGEAGSESGITIAWTSLSSGQASPSGCSTSFFNPSMQANAP